MSGNGKSIERKMSMVRRDLEEDAGQLADSARQLTDWRAYVRAYPWLCAGGAAALGFLLSPSRSRVAGGKAEGATAPTVAGGTVLGLLAASVGRAAVTYGARAAVDYLSAHTGHVRPTEAVDGHEEIV